MIFVADAMLGRLAKWLRFLGYDVLYFRDIDDRDLVRIARAEGRVLLTRDRTLAERFNVRSMLIRSDGLREQLLEVFSRFPPGEGAPRRCMKCNVPLEPVAEKTEVRDLVPEYIYIHHDLFQRCPLCGGVYWQGSHARNIMEVIEELNR